MENVSATERGPGTVEGIARAARTVSAVVGAWLFLSAFLLPHGTQEMVSDALVGAGVATTALAALYWRAELHVFGVLFSIWLFVSLFAIARPAWETAMHDLVVATILFGFSVVPDGWREHREQHVFTA
jgi:xanthine/uracil permease